MSRDTLSCISRLSCPRNSRTPPRFLTPSLESFAARSISISRPFSTTSQLAQKSKPRGKDKSRKRGVSAIHQTGPRWPLEMQNFRLPQPLPAESISTPEHGLWQFFGPSKKAIEKPEDHAAHGRGWTYAELSIKSWHDLHRLWWLCLKERNRISTSELERRRVKAGFGQAEANNRAREIKRTQNQIRTVLRDRYLAWSEARDLWQAGRRPGSDSPFEDIPVSEENEAIGTEDKLRDSEVLQSEGQPQKAQVTA